MCVELVAERNEGKSIDVILSMYYDSMSFFSFFPRLQFGTEVLGKLILFTLSIEFISYFENRKILTNPSLLFCDGKPEFFRFQFKKNLNFLFIRTNIRPGLVYGPVNRRMHARLGEKRPNNSLHNTSAFK
jgi:hypothetical protein